MGNANYRRWLGGGEVPAWLAGWMAGWDGRLVMMVGGDGRAGQGVVRVAVRVGVGSDSS